MPQLNAKIIAKGYRDVISAIQRMEKIERFDMFKFLEEYRRFPCLWRKSHPDFRDRAKRNRAEEELLPISGISSVNELRKKIRNIRCTYNQELSKIRKSMSSGSGDLYTPKLVWFAYAHSFLGENIEEVDSESNSTLPEYDAIEKQEYILSTTETVQERPEDAPNIPPVIPWGTLPKSRKRRATKSRRVKSKHKMMDSIADALKHVIVQGDTTENEFTMFGKHIATQLQCLPLEEAIKLQGEIQTLVTGARLRCVANANHTSLK